MAELLALHRYWMWANRLREDFDRSLGGILTGAASLDPDGWFASDVVTSSPI